MTRPVPVGDHLWAAVAAMDAEPLLRRHTHRQGLELAVRIGRFHNRRLIPPLAVTGVLDQAGVAAILLGAYAIAGWRKEPRATGAVDVLVPLRSHGRAVGALQARFPRLVRVAGPAGTQLVDPKRGRSVIDVFKPKPPLFRRALRLTRTIPGQRPYRIPTLEMAVALKFGGLSSPQRELVDRYQDTADFLALVDHNPDIDLETLAVLGELAHAGGGAEIVELVRKAQSGEPFQI